MNIDCDHRSHGCKGNSFIWVNDSRKIIYLEVPKNASSTLKKVLRVPPLGHDKNWKNLDRKEYIDNNDNYSNYFVFTIFRDMEERIISNYKDFCISKKEFRVKQMSSLFKLDKNRIEQLSVSDFLQLAHKYKDHHWNSQTKYMYLTLKKKPIIYHINDLDKLLEKLGTKAPVKANKSIEKTFEITNGDRQLIKKIYKEDYENIELINNNMFKSD
uniref:Sulfotransferase family protein n=1 Tax=viral metagenome TaxID=1070528 RepID=A0A6C0AHK9_9ZZZZ|tara:strand:+ start:4718 stop:5359 length:642 start_codon:yes stop_codon:yes gene_type:complete